MKHSDQFAQIAAALVKAQSAYTTVPKNKTATVKTRAGSEFTYRYADLADCLSMALPLLSANGIAFMQPHEMTDGKLRVKTLLVHESGEWMQSDGIEISEDGDPQQFGSESTYFRRYDGCSFIGIAPDEDTDAQGSAGKTRKVTPREAEKKAVFNAALERWPELAQTAVKEQLAASVAATDPDKPSFADGVLTCKVIGVEKEISAAKKEYLKVTFHGVYNGVHVASCFDTKLWPALSEAQTTKTAKFHITEKDSNGKHYINITGIAEVAGVMDIGI